jgi:UDP-N-acetylmuramoyl-L-alanyl-D-glutamate--2,6-diaminopimelate ligase
MTIKSCLIGSFNVENILAAIAAGIAMNFDLETIKSGIENLENIPGRLEPVNIDPAKTIIVDYSHTPDALQKALLVLAPLTTNRLWVVFGCGGDRDKTKRPLMGNIAQEFADQIIITSDNPRSESPLAIIQDILVGISQKENVEVEEDRKKAIYNALAQSEPGDTILIAGKGHEDYQDIQGVKHPFDDRQVIREFAA